MSLSSGLTATDLFCGMGGSSTGLVRAGFHVKLAANHWARAIETHSANHPGTEHLCADIQAVDLRYLPRTTVLWASPICTELSPAGGRRKKDTQADLFEEWGHVPQEGFTRTRVTFWEVIRAAEIHRYEIVLIENVVEAARWELFDVWLAGMTTLGYEHQFVSVSAAHVGGDDNPRAPQWRDRLYIVFNRKGVPRPDVEPRPLAWCPKCGTDVHAWQWWKRDGRKIGKYGSQYIYVCPVGNHGQVEPYVAPAAAAIDWTDPGTRIGDRTKPLAAATMRRIQAGLDMWQRGDFDRSYIMSVNHDDGRHLDPYATPLPTETIKQGSAIVVPARGGLPYSTDYPLGAVTASRTHGLVVAAAGNTYDAASRGEDGYVRAWPADAAPLQAQTTTSQLGLVTTLRRHGDTEPADDAPLTTVTAGGYHHGLITADAWIQKSHGGQLETRHALKSVHEPLPTTRAAAADMLVIPYRKGSTPYPAQSAPVGAQATHTQHGVMRPAITLEDCYFRMLNPREAANAQAFPGDYIITGNKGEQQKQAGNAVAVNVSAWLGARVVAALDKART